MFEESKTSKAGHPYLRLKVNIRNLKVLIYFIKFNYQNAKNLLIDNKILEIRRKLNSNDFFSFQRMFS